MAYKKETDYEGLQQLKNDLKAGTPAKLYFFYGEESYLKEYYFAALKKKLLGGAMEEFNYRRITAEEMSLEALRLAVDALPMLAERVLVRVEDYNPFLAAEGERENFISLISDLLDTCCLVFYYDTIPYKTDGKLKKLSAAVKEHGCAVEFYMQSERELCDWIARHFRSEGKSIHPELCRYLILLTGGKMHALDGEIRKISAYCSGQEIRKEDIDAVTEPTLTAAAFDLIDALAAGDADKTLRHLQSMLQNQEEPIAILGAVGAHLRKLLAAKTVRAAGGGPQQLMQTIDSRSDFYAKKLLQQADKLDESFCRQAVLDCFETDRALKSFGRDSTLTLELLLLKLAGKGEV